jgi:hypothetical protein
MNKIEIKELLALLFIHTMLTHQWKKIVNLYMWTLKNLYG